MTEDTKRIAEAWAFEREAWIGLADEFDPMGITGPEVTLDDFDPEWVEAARRFAARMYLPLPWEIRSMDNSIRILAEAEGRAE